MNPEIIGYTAAFFTTVAYIPQAIKVFREKRTDNLSLGMYSMITFGIFLWFIYGIMLNSPSLMLANGICFLLAGAILWMKLRCG